MPWSARAADERERSTVRGGGRGMALPPGRCFKSRAIPRYGFARVDVRFTFIATLSASARRGTKLTPSPVSPRRGFRRSSSSFSPSRAPCQAPAAAAAAATPRLRLAPRRAAAAAAPSDRPPRRPTPPPRELPTNPRRHACFLFFFFPSARAACSPAPGRDGSRRTRSAFSGMQKMTPFAPRSRLPLVRLVREGPHQGALARLRVDAEHRRGVARDGYNAPSGASTAPCHLLMSGPSAPFPIR